MKKITLAAAGILSLSACGSGNGSGNNTPIVPYSFPTTGTWDGLIGNSNAVLPLYMEIKQTDTPRNGDFDGQIIMGETDAIKFKGFGNANNGYLLFSQFEPSDFSGHSLSLDCRGTFTLGESYEGSCTLHSVYEIADVKIILRKRG